MSFQVSQLRSGRSAQVRLDQIRTVRSSGQVMSFQVSQLRSGLTGQGKLVSSSPVRLVRTGQFVSFRSSQARIGQVNLGQVGQVSSGKPVWVKPTKGW